MKYIANNMADLAAYFDSRAEMLEKARDAGEYFPRTLKRRHELRTQALVWKEAAEVIRNTTVKEMDQ
jgi:hypothetical protein